MKAINNISDFLRELTKLVHKSDDREYFFRGHANCNWDILPTIYRQPPNPEYITNEDKIFREIITKAPNEFINENSAIEKLVKMQHYGIPTRLLDITSNALVALYFACIEDKYNDFEGEIICFEVPKKRIKYYDSDQVSMLANLAKIGVEYKIEKEYLDYRKWLETEAFNEVLDNLRRRIKKASYDDFQVEKEIQKEQNEHLLSLFSGATSVYYTPEKKSFLKYYDPISDFDRDTEIVKKHFFYDFLQYFNSSDFASYLLHEIKNEKPQFKNGMNPFHFDNIIPVKVKQSNARIIKQSGAFLLFGIKDGDKSIPAEINQPGLDEKMQIGISKIGIKAKGIKRGIIKELETLGITESTLFPEIEHQAAVVKKLYC